MTNNSNIATADGVDYDLVDKLVDKLHDNIGDVEHFTSKDITSLVLTLRKSFHKLRPIPITKYSSLLV